jgi:sugar phosphate isomerase/epimerase
MTPPEPSTDTFDEFTMMRSAVTISLVREASGGPFVFWHDLAAGCARAAELGFDAVEVFPRSAAELDSGLLRRCLDQHDLKLAAMGTGAGWVVQRLRLTDPDESVRRRAIAFVREVVDVAGSFGAPAIIGSMQGRSEGGVSHEQHLVWLAEALDELAPRAADHGTTLLIEPLNRYETNLINSVADGAKLIGALKSKNVKLLCDLFHMNIEEPDIAAALGEAGPLVGHVHFADSNRRAVGFGHTPMAPVIGALRRIGYDGYLSAEVLPLPDSDEAARQTIASFRACLANEPDA